MFILGCDWFYRLGFFSAATFLLLAAALPRLGPRWGCFATVAVLTAHNCLLAAIIYAPVGSRQAGFNSWFARHPRLGLVGYPGSRGRNWNLPDFDAAHSFDESGWRRTPSPPRPAGEVLALGCSFTFGVGNSDDQTWPAQLARRHWPKYKVRNRGWPAAGTSFAHLVLVESLRSPERPRVVLYGMLSNHPQRNSFRRSWAEKLFGRAWLPDYSLEQGRLIYRGLVSSSRASLPDGPATDRRERDLALALLVDMHHRCLARGAVFAVIQLAERYPAPVGLAVLDACRAEGLLVIDASSATPSFFANDPHPRPAWHAATADLVAREPALAFLRNPAAAEGGRVPATSSHDDLP